MVRKGKLNQRPVSTVERKTTRASTKNNFNIATRSKTETEAIALSLPTNQRPVSIVERKTTRSQTKNNLRFLTTQSKTETEAIATSVPSVSSVPTNRLVRIKRFVKLQNYTENSIVLAKQKYSVPWPSRILKISKDRIKVYFFGDKREGTVASSEIYDFEQPSNGIKEVLSSKKSPRGYTTGIREIEILFGIPAEKSVFNTI